jgi:hypothetical protein
MHSPGNDEIDSVGDLAGSPGRKWRRIPDGLPRVLAGDAKLAGKECHGDPPPLHILPDPGHQAVDVRLFFECHNEYPVKRIPGDMYV